MQLVCINISHSYRLFPTDIFPTAYWIIFCLPFSHWYVKQHYKLIQPRMSLLKWTIFSMKTKRNLLYAVISRKHQTFSRTFMDALMDKFTTVSTIHSKYLPYLISLQHFVQTLLGGVETLRLVEGKFTAWPIRMSLKNC